MKSKPLFIVAVVVALAAFALLIGTWLQPNGSISKTLDGSSNAPGKEFNKGADQATKKPDPPRDEAASDANSDTAPPLAEEPSFQLVGTKGSFDPVADAQRRKNLPYQMFGSGGTGKIVDRDGNVILQSDSENPIFKYQVSPDENRIAVHRGSGTYDIFTPSTGETIQLPQQPPGENVLGFGSWHWIDERTLIGVSGKTIPFRDDQVGPEREEPIISRSVLYLYDLEERRMSEVALPPALRLQGVRIVSVNAVDETGKVQLRPEGREVSYTDASLGWFEVRPKE